MIGLDLPSTEVPPEHSARGLEGRQQERNDWGGDPWQEVQNLLFFLIKRTRFAPLVPGKEVCFEIRLLLLRLKENIPVKSRSWSR